MSLKSFQNWDVEDHEFRRMLKLSTAFHLAVAGGILMTTSFSSRRYVEAASLQPMDIMWAHTVTLPLETPPNKLPGPAMTIQPNLESPMEDPSLVLQEDQRKPIHKEKLLSREEQERQKAMREAVAALRKRLDDRPMPRLDNFPSKGGLEKLGLPAGPTGKTGVVSGNMMFSQYKNQVQKTIVDNFNWIQKQTQLKAEVTFGIDPSGNILDPVITKGSGNFAFDQAALRAVRKSSPLPQPPSDLAKSLTAESFVVIFDPRAQ